MNILYRDVLFPVLVCTIVGCGGGGGDSGGTKEPLSSETSVITQASIETTDELVSNTTFEFTSGFELTLILSALDGTKVPHFVNVCSDYSQVEDVYTINYDSCRLRTSFTDELQQFHISLSAAETVLIAQIWPIENNAVPINLFWSRTNSSENWEIDVNN